MKEKVKDRVILTGKISLLLVLYSMIFFFIISEPISIGVHVIPDLDDANNESLANIWGKETIQGINDNIDRSNDTFLLAILFFIGVLAIHSQFKNESSKDEDNNG